MGFFGSIGHAIGGAAGKVGGALGISKSGGEKAGQRAFQIFSEIEDPELKKLVLKKYVSSVDPRKFLKELSETELSKIQSDPILREAQMSALSRVQAIADQGGLTAEDRARLADIQRRQKVTEKGQREAIAQQAAQRGIGGSGLQLQQQIAGQQEQANIAAQQGTDVAAEAQRRQMQAALEAGRLGGDIRSQEFSEAARRAEAQDLINKFNVGARNEAGLELARQRQRIAEQNVNLANQSRLYNIGRDQQAFENQMQIAAGKAGALQQIGAGATAREGRLAGLIGGGISAAAGAGGART